MDDKYNDELEQAIKLSLQNFSKPKSNHKEDVPLEEEKNGVFFTSNDLLISSHSADYPMSIEEAKDESLFYEENKETTEPKEVISTDPPISVDPTRELLTEYMVILEVHLEDKQQLEAVLKILSKLIGNVWKDPNETKYHKIKLNNKKIQDTIGIWAPALFLLEIVGFRRTVEEERIDQFTVQKVDTYVLDYDSLNFETFEYLQDQIKAKLDSLSSRTDSKPQTLSSTKTPTVTSTGPKTYESAGGYNNKYVPMNSKRRQAVEKLANQKKNNTNMLYTLAQERERRKAEQPHLYKDNPYSVTSLNQAPEGASVWDQLKFYRK